MTAQKESMSAGEMHRYGCLPAQIPPMMHDDGAYVLYADAQRALDQERDKVRKLREVLEFAASFIPHNDYDDSRCQICGWPLRSDGTGCNKEVCYYIPNDRDVREVCQIRQQRAWVDARAALSDTER